MLRITLYNEDCLEGMKRIPDGSVDCIICDLPYGTSACDWDGVIPFEPLWEQYRRVVKKNGNVILFASGRFLFSLYASQPDFYRYDLVWKKSKCGSPFTAKYMPLKRHEHILVFGHPGAVYNPQMESGSPYRRRWTPNRRNEHHYGIKGVSTDNRGTRHPTTILDFPQRWRRQDQIHPTQKPVELIQWLLRTYSNPGDTVLDNCMGSGTTAVACIREKRHFIGFELDKVYFEKATKRISQEQLKLF